MRIHIAPLESRPPFDPEVLVFEQDAELILRLDREAEMPQEGTSELIREAMAPRKHTLGTLVIDGDEPTLVMAIVNDLDQTPSCREAWVRMALAALFAYLGERGARNACMPLLGTVHGGISTQRAVELLESALADAEVLPEALWITAPESVAPGLQDRWND